MRPHSECFAMFFNVKAAVSRMCLVTGPSFSSYKRKQMRFHVSTSGRQACIWTYIPSNNGVSHIIRVNLEQQMPFYAKSRMVWIKRVLMVTASLVLLTVKSLNTRFREPLRRAMSAALGWFTIAFGARCAGLLLASDGVLYKHTYSTIRALCQISPHTPPIVKTSVF